MGKTTYSKNPSTSKGTHHQMQSPNHQPEISESIIKTHMRLPKLSKVFPSPKPNNISRTSSDTEDAFLTLSTTEASAEPGKQLSSEKPLEDGHRNQSRLFWDSLITSNPTPTLKTLKTLQSIMSKLIELLRAVEELTEPTVESVPIFPHKLISKSSRLRKP